MHRIASRAAHRDHLEGYNVNPVALYWGEVVGQAQPFAFSLPGETEAQHFTLAPALVMWVVDNQLVAAGLAGEIAIDDPGLQVTLLAGLAQHALQAWTELSLYQAGKFRSVSFATPVQPVERIEIH